MELIGLIAAIIGLVSALINRKRIIVIQDERCDAAGRQTGRRPIAIRKRLKRLCVALALGFGMMMIAVATMDDPRRAAEVVVWPFFACIVVAAYQFAAIVVMILVRIWR